MTIILDASGIAVGRLASLAAKKTLLGETVIVVNAEKAIVVGKPEIIMAERLKKLNIKNLASKNVGPFHYRRPDRVLRKTIRGMLPWAKPKGRQAFKRVMVYVGEPAAEIKKDYGIDYSKEKKTSLKNLKKDVDSYLTLGEICKTIGGKW